MVNTRTDAELAAAVQAAVTAMLLTYVIHVVKELPLYKIFDVMVCDDGFKGQVLDVYKFEGDALAWWKGLQEGMKEMQWISLCWADFKELRAVMSFAAFYPFSWIYGHAAGTAEDSRHELSFGVFTSRIIDRILCMEFTDVLKLQDAARNFEILRDRE
ncbi:hypothetical protein Tco_0839695 [Tanacetum coccineum]|uniref:Retrotransposon gag domain-containing protein n=1 Tax=Tanacetum coccineum TaxID=301880 RepID=A0ABQ5AV87_9ASTR